MDLKAIERALASRERRVIPHEGRPVAAVLVTLYGPPPDFRIIYTVRSYDVEHHKGEISFPGGVRDRGDDSLAATALRESFEEVGIKTEDVSVLGMLDDIVTITNFVVTPVVGRVEGHPYPFRPFEPEVAELLEVPLSHLRDPVNHVAHPKPPRGLQLPFPSFRFGEHLIFGATARMTASFLELLGEIAPLEA